MLLRRAQQGDLSHGLGRERTGWACASSQDYRHAPRSDRLDSASFEVKPNEAHEQFRGSAAVNGALEPGGFIGLQHALLAPIVAHLHSSELVLAAHAACLAERLLKTFDPAKVRRCRILEEATRASVGIVHDRPAQRYKKLEDDSRYKAFLRKMNLPE